MADQPRTVADTVVTGLVRLPAVVTLPAGADGDVPMVVMVHGSGPLDRDETVCANKPFADLATMLARRGIGSLRYDKRTFVYRRPVASMDDETIDDALSAIDLAHRYGRRMFVVGHSLGAMLAPAIAERARDGVAGIVMMAAPARDLEQVVREQIDYLLPSGASDDYRRQQMDMLRQRAPHYFAPQGQVETALRIGVPMLVMQGGRDYQVSMADYELWQQRLGGRKDTTFRSYERLNHLFAEGEGRSTPLEYHQATHVAECVAEDIAAFVFSH